jgi:hypothetical protein
MTGERSSLNTSEPQAARRYDYLLGGKDNFAADRSAADELAAACPGIGAAARENRAWLQRVVRFLAADLGIRQFLDIGVGLPATPNVHEIAQQVTPAARVLYVDHDPLVAVHARALLSNDRTRFGHADLRRSGDLEALLKSRAYREVIACGEPVGLLLVAVLHFLPDADLPYDRVRQLVDALPAGSYVAISHVSFELINPDSAGELAALQADVTASQGPFRVRTANEITRFLDGLELIPPGLVPVVDWYPDREPAAEIPVADSAFYAVVARKP